MKKNGFTLVELLITISIIGLLAGMILPRLFGPTERGRSSEGSNMLGAIRQLESTVNSKDGVYAAIAANDDTGWQNLGIENPNNNPNRYFDYVITVNAGNQLLIKATRNNVNYNGLANATMCLNDAGTWSGTYAQVPENRDAALCNAGTEACC